MLLPAVVLALALFWFAALRPGYREAVAETAALWAGSGRAWISAAFLLEFGRALGRRLLAIIAGGAVIAALFALGGPALVIVGAVGLFIFRYVSSRYEEVQAEPVTPCGLIMPGGDLARVECGAAVCYCRAAAEHQRQKAVA